jgi:hypothetical protein
LLKATVTANTISAKGLTLIDYLVPKCDEDGRGEGAIVMTIENLIIFLGLSDFYNFAKKTCRRRKKAKPE